MRISVTRGKLCNIINKFSYKFRFHVIQILILLTLIITIYYYHTTKLISPSKNKNEKYTAWLKEHGNISYFISQASYVNEMPTCKDGTEVIIGVISAPSHTSARNAIRISLAKHLPTSWMVLFFVGKSQNTIIEDKIKEETKTWNDVVQLEVEDSYLNLTIKVSLLLDWVNHKCQQANFLIKADDDVYINSKNMARLLNCCSFTIENMYSPRVSSDCGKWKPKSIIGHFIDAKSKNYISYVAGGYMYSGIKVDRDPTSKWYLSPSLYSDSEFPDMVLSGTSYLMSTTLIPFILHQATKVPLINLEDAYITGLVMRKHMNLKLSHIDGWSNFRPRWDDACLYSTLLTSHGLNSQEMLSITEEVANLNGKCGPLRQLAGYANKIISYYIPRFTL